jgi:GT2 family glycosyltransferase
LLRRCREGIDGKLFNVIVVSGGSFAENCNKGAKIATTDKIIFLNDDVETETEPLAALAKSNCDICGITQTIGGKMIYGMGWHKQQYSVAESFFLSETADECKVPSGHCFMITKKAWQKLGGFDEQYINGAEDCELFFAAMEKKMTMEIIDYPMAHLHSQSENRYDMKKENWNIFNKRWALQRVKKLIKSSKKLPVVKFTDSLKENVASGWIEL